MAKPSTITKLHNHHYKAVEMMLRGLSKAEVARKLGMSRQSVTHWSNHEPLFIEEYQRRFAEIREYSLKGHAEFIEEINGGVQTNGASTSAPGGRDARCGRGPGGSANSNSFCLI